MGCEFSGTGEHSRQYSFGSVPASMPARDDYAQVSKSTDYNQSSKDYN